MSKRTIQKYMRQIRKPGPVGPSWSTFLRTHAPEMWACDLVQTYDVLFRPIFGFFIVTLDRRRVVHHAVTRHPSDAWLAQCLRGATAYGRGPRFLIRDRDDKYGAEFKSVAQSTHIHVIRTAVRVPKMNATCERFMGSLRRECLDHVLVLSESHLRKVVTEYVAYFNRTRPHQALGQEPPVARPTSVTRGRIVAFPVLEGLHHDYQWAA